MYWARTIYGLALCALAGFSGASAAVFGKLTGLDNTDQPTRITCYLLLIVCNALMLVLYSRALRYNSSLACTASTTAVNISATGLLGHLVFGEATSLQWWVGASSIFLGSFLISRSQKQEQPAEAGAQEPPASTPIIRDGQSVIKVPAAARRTQRAAAAQQEIVADGQEVEDAAPAGSRSRRRTRRD